MRYNVLRIALVVGIGVLSVGCSEDKTGGEESKQSNSLYADLKEVYRIYADSLASTDDSAKIDTIACNLDDKVRRIYLSYPPDLDFNISESQNDTLWRYVARITQLRNRLRKSIEIDSLVTDSDGFSRDSVDDAILK